MIDAGDEKHGDTIVNYLKSQGVDDLELVVATHPHADHIGGLPPVFEAYKVERYIHSGTFADTLAYKTLMYDVIQEGCPVSPDADEVIRYDDLTLRIIETGDLNEDLNDDSVVVLASYGDTDILLTGDAGINVEHMLARTLNIGHIEVFKAGHHGSSTSNSSLLLSKITPDISIISYGADNTYGHPHKEATERLQKYSGQVLWTAGETVLITTDGHSLKLN